MPTNLIYPFLMAVCPGMLGVGPQRTSRSITAADAVMAVYTVDCGLRSSGEPQLVLAIWPEGRIIWSEDQVIGGSPYHSGKIEAGVVNSFFSGLERDGFYADQRLNEVNFGPDSRFTTIVAKSGKNKLKMQSWHELYEASGKIVATKTGLAPLAGRSRLAVLSKEPADYLFYRLAWSELRQRSSALIPSQSLPVQGKLLAESGVFSWVEIQDSGAIKSGQKK